MEPHLCTCTQHPLPAYDVLYVVVPGRPEPAEVWRCSHCWGWEDARTLQDYLARDPAHALYSHGGMYSREAQQYF
jgi:hypothetical protein